MVNMIAVSVGGKVPIEERALAYHNCDMNDHTFWQRQPASEPDGRESLGRAPQIGYAENST